MKKTNCVLTSKQAKCCVISQYLLSYSHVMRPLATLTMRYTIYWHLENKQDRGQDDVYLLFDHYISFLSANYTHTTSLFSPLHLCRWNFISAVVVYHLPEIGINKLTGRPCLDSSDDVVCVYISRLDTAADGRNSEGITFQCLSHLASEM